MIVRPNLGVGTNAPLMPSDARLGLKGPRRTRPEIKPGAAPWRSRGPATADPGSRLSQAFTRPRSLRTGRRVHPGPKGRKSRTPLTFPCITVCFRDRGKGPSSPSWTLWQTDAGWWGEGHAPVVAVLLARNARASGAETVSRVKERICSSKDLDRYRRGQGGRFAAGSATAGRHAGRPPPERATTTWRPPPSARATPIAPFVFRKKARYFPPGDHTGADNPTEDGAEASTRSPLPSTRWTTRSV
jgi:hypothetical protein